jgi:hypothetical protein
MGAHIFRVGDLVRLRNPGLAAPGNAYEVRPLPLHLMETCSTGSSPFRNCTTA